MYDEIKEKILVGVVFSGGKIIPRFFVWNKRKYPVEKVNYFWRSKAGSFPIFHYAVTNCDSVYEISYNLRNSEWNLEKIYVES